MRVCPGFSVRLLGRKPRAMVKSMRGTAESGDSTKSVRLLRWLDGTLRPMGSQTK